MARSKGPQRKTLKVSPKERFAQLIEVAEQDIRSGRVRSARAFLKDFKKAKKIAR